MFRLHGLAARAVSMVLMLMAGALASAQQNAATPEDRFGQGLLWRVSKGDAAPSYLFGTIHLSDTRVTTLAEPVERAFGEATLMVSEAPLGAEAMAAMAQSMMLSPGESLGFLTGAQVFDQLLPRVSARGVPAQVVDRLKPWVVATILVVPGDPGLSLDVQLYRRAQQRGIATAALETVEEQVDVLDGMGLFAQIAMLRDALAHADQMPVLLESLIVHYVARDVAGLAQLAVAGLPITPDSKIYQDELRRRAIDLRNPRMVERLHVHLAKGGAFVAIGAAHLPGKEGVLASLERAGYKVSLAY